jgi:hypothetical protein
LQELKESEQIGEQKEIKMTHKNGESNDFHTTGRGPSVGHKILVTAKSLGLKNPPRVIGTYDHMDAHTCICPYDLLLPVCDLLHF